MATSEDTWTEWGQHVLKELERLGDECVGINKKLDNHLQHTEKRITTIETTLKNLKWILGITFTLIIAILTLSLIHI